MCKHDLEKCNFVEFFFIFFSIFSQIFLNFFCNRDNLKSALMTLYHGPFYIVLLNLVAKDWSKKIDRMIKG